MKRVAVIILAAVLGFSMICPAVVSAQENATVPDDGPVDGQDGGQNADSAASVDSGQEAQPDPGQTPVRIKADKMAYSDTGKTVSFFGNVKVTRNNMVLWTDKITAFFPESGKADKIDRILAEGSVRVEMDGRTGRCRKLIYYVEDGILRMEGSPSLTEGRNTVRGAVIKFYLKDSRSEILGGRNRQVEAVFVTPEDMNP